MVRAKVVDPQWLRMAESLTKRCKKDDLVRQIARLLSEKDAMERECQKTDTKLTEAVASLNEFKNIKEALAEVKKVRHGDEAEFLSAIIDKSAEIIEAVKERDAEDATIEDLEEDRERMLRALGMTEDQWLVKGWRY